MQIFLIAINDRRHLFYSEPTPGDGDVSRRGARGWLERKSRRMKAALRGSKGGVGRFARRAWEWLQGRVSPDEVMLRRLRRARLIELFHPTTLGPDQARAAWATYLAERRRRHLGWLGLNLLVSPLTILLMPVPGPNVLGYWFVYRAVCHALAWLGAWRAGGLAVECEAAPALDAPLGEAGREEVGRVAAALGLRRLNEFLRRSAVATPVAAEPVPTC